MKKYLIILLAFVCMFSCKPKQHITASSNQSTNHDVKTEIIDSVVIRDNVVIRDSVVIRPDGSVDRWHNEKVTSKDIKKLVIRIRERLVITNTLQITKTITITKPKIVKVKTIGFFWWVGLLFSSYISIFLITKIYKFYKKIKP